MFCIIRKPLKVLSPEKTSSIYRICLKSPQFPFKEKIYKILYRRRPLEVLLYLEVITKVVYPNKISMILSGLLYALQNNFYPKTPRRSFDRMRPIICLKFKLAIFYSICVSHILSLSLSFLLRNFF